jgi:hypothetical protein
MKALSLFVAALIALPALAADREHCSINVAKRFADAVIEADRTVNGDSGHVVWKRSLSREYTIPWCEEQARLGADPRGEYKKMAEEMKAHPDYRFYRLQYSVVEESGNNTAYYWKLHLKNYDRGCALENLISD